MYIIKIFFFASLYTMPVSENCFIKHAMTAHLWSEFSDEVCDHMHGKISNGEA